MTSELGAPPPRSRAVAWLVVLGVAVLVAGVLLAVPRLSNDRGPRSGAPRADAPTASGSPSAFHENCDGSPGPEYSPLPPITDLEAQQKIVDDITSRSWPDFKVEYAEPTRLGVIAVTSGDYEKGDAALKALGVSATALFEQDMGEKPADRVVDAEQDMLDPTIAAIDRARRGIPGYAELALWQEAGAIVVHWKAPVPPEIQALEGVRPDRTRIYVVPVTYSDKDLRIAQDKVIRAMDDGSPEQRARWAMVGSSGCSDGIQVTVVPESLKGRRDALQKELTRVAGVPVFVVAGEAPVAM